MNEVDRWKNRRKMAWISMIAGLLFPLLLLATDSPQLGAIAGPFYIFISAVVGAYIGFATVDDHWNKNYNDRRYGGLRGGGRERMVDDGEVQRR
jgi:hypothetical protein